jgi:hypothetical protein
MKFGKILIFIFLLISNSASAAIIRYSGPDQVMPGESFLVNAYIEGLQSSAIDIFIHLNMWQRVPAAPPFSPFPGDPPFIFPAFLSVTSFIHGRESSGFIGSSNDLYITGHGFLDGHQMRSINPIFSFTVQTTNNVIDHSWDWLYPYGYHQPNFIGLQAGSYLNSFYFPENDQEYSFTVLYGEGQAVPLPSAIWLLFLGIAGLMGMREKLKN